MKLRHVLLQKTDTCLTYALKRTGKRIPGLTDSAAIEQYFTLNPIAKDLRLGEVLEVGAIIMFDHKEHTEIIPCEITAEGVIISHEITLLRHFAVYEGNGLISDCLRFSDEAPYAKMLRIRKVDELENPPSFILEYNG